jgi:ParB/RepB/Spo0J family partition protein
MVHEIKKIDINLLTPRPGNPNELDAKGYNFLMKEIKKRGMVQPILVDKDYVIIDGEHRWRASKQVGLTEVDVVMVDVDKYEAMAALINMNQIKGEFDPTKLGLMIESIIDEKGRDELEKLLALDKSAMDDMVKLAEGEQVKKKKSNVFENYTVKPDPEEFSKYPVQVGEIWACGNHRVICGDIFESSALDRLFSDADISTCKLALIHPDRGSSDVGSILSAVMSYAASAMVIPDKYDLGFWLDSLLHSEYPYDIGAWQSPDNASNEVNGLLATNGLFRPLLYIMRDMPPSEIGSVLQNDILYAKFTDAFIEQERYDDPLSKDFVQEILRLFSSRGDIIFDPFLGSGTSLIAAQIVKRAVYAMDINPAYCNMALSRWARLTGQTPERL